MVNGETEQDRPGYYGGTENAETGSDRPGGDPAGKPEARPGGDRPGDAGPGFGGRHWRGLTVLGAILLAFLIGFGLQFFRAQQASRDLDRTQATLHLTRMEATLAAATVDAQRGNYESARVLASEFFSELQGRVDQAPREAQDDFRTILAERDDVITALSRGAPDSGERLAALLVRYRVGWRGPDHALPLPGTDAAAPPP